MGKYQAYPEYKDSGIDSLGSVPSHWEVMQLKRSLNCCVNGIWGSEPNNDGFDTIVIRVADFNRQKLAVNDYGFTFRKIEDKEKIGRLLKKGDLLLEKSGGGEKTLVGQVVLFDKDFEAVTSNFVAKMTPADGFDGRYLNYVFCRFYSHNLNYGSIKQNTGIQNLDSASYLTEKFGFPNLDEQLSIANFLDHETAKIDTLIEQQQQLIQLLKEKRQAVISHAVTKGLDPNTPMKDSGVEWLGEVPAHWDIKNIGRISDVKRGSGYQNIDMEIEGKECIGMLRISDMHSVEPITIVKTNEVMRYTVQAGDILVAGTGATAGISMIVDAKDHGLVHSYNSIMIRPKGNLIVSKFIHYFLCSDYISSVLDVSFVGSAQPFVDTNGLRKLPILIPPHVEQQKIVQYLNEKLQKLSELFEHAEHMVSILNERRTALISAAVTGKIDVRNWQALQQS